MAQHLAAAAAENAPTAGGRPKAEASSIERQPQQPTHGKLEVETIFQLLINCP
jgi:hypothetical protein